MYMVYPNFRAFKWIKVGLISAIILILALAGWLTFYKGSLPWLPAPPSSQQPTSQTAQLCEEVANSPFLQGGVKQENDSITGTLAGNIQEVKYNKTNNSAFLTLTAEGVKETPTYFIYPPALTNSTQNVDLQAIKRGQTAKMSFTCQTSSGLLKITSLQVK